MAYLGRGVYGSGCELGLRCPRGPGKRAKLAIINVAKHQAWKTNAFFCQMLLQINIFRQNSVFWAREAGEIGTKTVFHSGLAGSC